MRCSRDRPEGHRQRYGAGAGSVEPAWTGALLPLAGIVSATLPAWVPGIKLPPITGAESATRRFYAPSSGWQRGAARASAKCAWGTAAQRRGRHHFPMVYRTKLRTERRGGTQRHETKCLVLSLV